MADYITISEFSERAGISRQAIRKNKKLAEYIIKEPGKQLMIDSAALAIYSETDAQPSCNQDATKTQPDRNDHATLATIDALQSALEILREQLATKDAIIEEKDAQIRVMADRLADLAERGNDIADKSIIALQQRHALDAAEMQQAMTKPAERIQWWQKIWKKF